jgi:F-type H+-transporting ATPase subunit b
MSSSVALSVLLSGGSVIDLDGTIFVQVLLFFVAFFLLYNLVFKPVLSLLDAREQAIEGTKEQAGKLLSDADAKRVTLEEELKKIWHIANQDRDRLRLEGQQSARQLTEQAHKETESALAQAKAKLEAEGGRLRAEVTSAVPALARQIASKLLDRDVS